MEYKKKTHKYAIDDHSTKYITKYESPPCDFGDHSSYFHKMELLRFIVNNFNSLNVISRDWEEAYVKHNGTAWEISLETTVEENNF